MTTPKKSSYISTSQNYLSGKYPSILNSKPFVRPCYDCVADRGRSCCACLSRVFFFFNYYSVRREMPQINCTVRFWNDNALTHFSGFLLEFLVKDHKYQNLYAPIYFPASNKKLKVTNERNTFDRE